MAMALGVFLLGGLIMMQVVRTGIMGLVGGSIGYSVFAIFTLSS